MSMLPVRCLDCSRVLLVSCPSTVSPALHCLVCGGLARPIPSCVYLGMDASEFSALSEIAAEGHLTVGEALAHSRQVERALWIEYYHPAIELLTTRMPDLLPIQLAVGKDLLAQRRLLTMLRTILDGLAGAQPARHAG